MTICIGVLCDNRKKAVVAADRMVTAGDVEFEQDLLKIERITDACSVLSAGSALRQVDLLRRTRAALSSRRDTTVNDVVAEVKNQFVSARKQRAEEVYLKPLGMSLEYFMETQGRLPEGLALRLTRNIETQHLGLELLVAGVDSAGAHLYYVSDPGTADCFDAIGFCAIGSGERHAELAFMRRGHSPRVRLDSAVFMAYQAKRDSEVAPGVGGRFTDIAVIDESGTRFIDPQSLQAMADVYSELSAGRDKILETVESKVSGLTMGWIE